jgi:hypothetical protein
MVETMRKFSLAMLMLAACGQGSRTAADSAGVGVASRTIADEPSAVIDSARGVVLGIFAGMTADSVKKVLGAPLREGVDANDSLPSTLLEYPMGSIRIRQRGGVVEFLCGGDECRTVDSVGIGDSSDVLLATYGPSPPRGPVDAPEALDYRLGESGCNLTFTLASGRVTSVNLGCAVR